MDEKVIQFPRRNPSGSFAGRRPSEEEKQRDDEEKRRREAEQIRENIARVVSDKGKRGRRIGKDKAGDRRQIARNLGKIFQTLEKASKIKRRLVLVEAGFGGNQEDSTKKLYTYTLPDGLTEEQEAKRSRKLGSKLDNYIKLTEAAAKLAGRHKDHFIPDLFRDTSFATDSDINDADRAWLQDIRDLLRSMADSAIRQQDLGSYMETLSCGYLGWHAFRGFGSAFGLPWDPKAVFDSLCFGGRPVVIEDPAANIWIGYLGFVPSVLLYEEPLGTRQVERLVYRESEREAQEKAFEAAHPEMGRQGCYQKFLDSLRTRVSISVTREIHFGIAPFDWERRWEPCFEKRLRYDVRAGEISFTTYAIDIGSCSYDMNREPAEMIWDSHQTTNPDILTIECEDSDDNKDLRLDEDFIGNGEPNFSCFRYEIVSLESCQKYLGRFANKDEGERIWKIFLGDWWRGSVDVEDDHDEHKADWHFPAGVTPCLMSPLGSIARAVEQNLIYEKEPLRRLDYRFFSDIQKKMRDAEAIKSAVGLERHNLAQDLKNRWEGFATDQMEELGRILQQFWSDEEIQTFQAAMGRMQAALREENAETGDAEAPRR